MTTATVSVAVDPRRTNAASSSASYTQSLSHSTDNFVLVVRGGLIPVDVRETADGFLATDRLVDRWGSGATAKGALDDLFASLGDYLEDLEQHDGRLSPRLEHQMHVLQAVLEVHGGA